MLNKFCLSVPLTLYGDQYGEYTDWCLGVKGQSHYQAVVLCQTHLKVILQGMSNKDFLFKYSWNFKLNCLEFWSLTWKEQFLNKLWYTKQAEIFTRPVATGHKYIHNQCFFLIFIQWIMNCILIKTWFFYRESLKHDYVFETRRDKIRTGYKCIFKSQHLHYNNHFDNFTLFMTWPWAKCFPVHPFQST